MRGSWRGYLASDVERGVGSAERGEETMLLRAPRSALPATICNRVIETRALRKVYVSPAGKRGAPRRPDVVALDALDLTVSDGEFFGLLGPNGAGKTTTIGILTTRVLASAGKASVAGADVINDPVGVRRKIGVVPQRANPDRGLDVLENLAFHAAYFALRRAAAP